MKSNNNTNKYATTNWKDIFIGLAIADLVMIVLPVALTLATPKNSGSMAGFILFPMLAMGVFICLPATIFYATKYLGAAKPVGSRRVAAIATIVGSLLFLLALALTAGRY